MDDKARYAVYRVNNGKCHYCGTRLNWDAYETRGLGGAWVLEEGKSEGEKAQALCYKCFEFEGRGKTARRLVVSEPKGAVGLEEENREKDASPGVESVGAEADAKD
jgi:hypothetical protein